MGQLILTQNATVDTPAAGAVILANKNGDIVKKDSGGNEYSIQKNKNAIINPFMDIWQRGTSFTGLGGGTTFIADRWAVVNGSSVAVLTGTQQTSVPTVAQAGVLFNYSLRLGVSTIDASLTTTDFCSIKQTIEGYNWRYFAQRPLTLSFWINANKAGTYCVCFNNNAAGTPDRAFVAEYTISAADVSAGWVKKTISVPASPSAGTWNYTNSAGCRIDFSFGNAIGGTYQGSANGQWNTVTNYVLGTSSSTNGMDSTSNTFHLTGIQLEVGNSASELEWRPHSQELSLCQRYCYVINVAASRWIGQAYGSNSVALVGQYPVEMRGNPTLAKSGDNVFDVFNSTLGASAVTTTIGSLGGNNISFYIPMNATAGLTAGDAALISHAGSSRYLWFEAEL